MSSEFTIDVNEATFEFEVLKYSENTPVVVDFWAAWCQPCKTLTPLLEKIVEQTHGAFRLARLDTDANPNLTIRYNVRSLPTVKAFSSGEVVAEFVGLLPEPRLLEFFSRITPPSTANLALEKADGLLSMNMFSEAENTYRQILQETPIPGALLGLVKTLLRQGKVEEASQILHQFPASRQYAQAQTLLPFADVLTALQHNILPDETPLDATFINCIRLAKKGNFPAALDGILDILRQNKHYRNDRARLVALSLFELAGEESPFTRQYRSELASVLF